MLAEDESLQLIPAPRPRNPTSLTFQLFLAFPQAFLLCCQSLLRFLQLRFRLIALFGRFVHSLLSGLDFGHRAFVRFQHRSALWPGICSNRRQRQSQTAGAGTAAAPNATALRDAAVARGTGGGKASLSRSVADVICSAVGVPISSLPLLLELQS